MKTLLIVTCACLFFVACASSVSGNGTDELYIRVALTTGEQGKDTSSETTTITVARDVIEWEQTSRRDRRRGTPPLRKEFKLPPADKGNLLKLIRSNNLLVTGSIFFPIWIAGLGLMQAREKTCIVLTARGMCSMDAGETNIVDSHLIRQLRQKARRINRRSLITAAVITLLALVFPRG